MRYAEARRRVGGSRVSEHEYDPTDAARAACRVVDHFLLSVATVFGPEIVAVSEMCHCGFASR